MRCTIQYVNQPRNPAGKYGNVKTSDGQTIMVPVAAMGQYIAGSTYDIPTESRTWGQGADAKPVTVAVGHALPVGGIQASSQPNRPYGPGQAGYTQAYQAQQGLADHGLFPPSDQVGARPAQGRLPEAGQIAGNVVHLQPGTAQAASAGPARGNPEARMIWATGVCGRAMGSGKFTASEIEVLLGAALDAYDRRVLGLAPDHALGNQAVERSNDSDIPY